MKSFNDYMEISYKMEVIEDKEEGGYVVSYPICLVVLLVEKLLNKQ